RVVELHAKVKVRITETVIAEDGSRGEQTRVVDTTVGRALLREILRQFRQRPRDFFWPPRQAAEGAAH
ncbi:hypothetical protein ABTE60_19705, partial [Acinetobacter baumannii]